MKGIDNIKPERRNSRCVFCGQASGATVVCAHSKCHVAFHPLCARRAGCFSVCRHSQTSGRPVYKTWCRQHSEAARRREQEARAPGIADKGTAVAEQPAVAPAMAPAVAQELATLRQQLRAQEGKKEFMQSVRLDLEAARNLGAQVRVPPSLSSASAPLFRERACVHHFKGMHVSLRWPCSWGSERRRSLRSRTCSGSSTNSCSRSPRPAPLSRPTWDCRHTTAG